MTGSVYILGLILAVGLVLAFELVKMSDSSAESPDAVSLHRALDRLATYRPMSRLFALTDFEDVRSQPELISSLRSQRKKAMRLYLRQLRSDFMQVWSACRLLAPVSTDPDFGFNLIRNLVTFQLFVSALHVRCFLGYWGSVDQDLNRLASTLTGLQSQATTLLHAPGEAGA